MKKPVDKVLDLVGKDIGLNKKQWYRDRKQKWERSRSNHFKSLIGSILSARNRDESTALVVNRLFSKYKTPKQMANAPIKSIEKLIKQSGFYKTKARYVRETSKQLIERFDGKVPDNMDDLLTLPGVGRKVAGVVLVYSFGRNISIPTDTHVHRLSNRIGLVKTKTPEKTEQELMKIIPKKDWIIVNELFVSFGKKICKPIGPLHEQCPVRFYCDYYKTIKKKGKA